MFKKKLFGIGNNSNVPSPTTDSHSKTSPTDSQPIKFVSKTESNIRIDTSDTVLSALDSNLLLAPSENTPSTAVAISPPSPKVPVPPAQNIQNNNIGQSVSSSGGNMLEAKAPSGKPVRRFSMRRTPSVSSTSSKNHNDSSASTFAVSATTANNDNQIVETQSANIRPLSRSITEPKKYISDVGNIEDTNNCKSKIL
jgi:hypothetical protein